MRGRCRTGRRRHHPPGIRWRGRKTAATRSAVSRAIGRLSHHRLEHVDLRTGAETLIMALAVIYAWYTTARVANWLEPDPHRLLQIGRSVFLIVALRGRALGEHLVNDLGHTEIAGGHLLERFRLFFIIALGETVIMTGTAFGFEVRYPLIPPNGALEARKPTAWQKQR